jgi:hypothetical protein
MVVLSLLAPAPATRAVNITVSLLYIASIAVATAGETWVFVEVALLLTIARVAWKWPERGAQPRGRSDWLARRPLTPLGRRTTPGRACPTWAPSTPRAAPSTV